MAPEAQQLLVGAAEQGYAAVVGINGNGMVAATVAAATPSSARAPFHGLGEREEGIDDRTLKRRLGMAYMLAMGMCGVLLVALGSTLQQLSKQCGRDSTDVGTVFIARGVGAVLGALCSAGLFKQFPGDTIICTVLFALCCLLQYLPWITSVVLLHVSFLFLGLCTSVIDTGCQIMTRRVHGKDAGPWLSGNTVAFGISGAVVPLIGYFTTSIVVEFMVLTALGAAAIAVFLLLPRPETSPGFIGKEVEEVSVGVAVAEAEAEAEGGGAARGSGNFLGAFFRTFQAECFFSFMVFWLIGGNVGATAYLTQYVLDTDVVADTNADLIVMALWVAVAFGRLAGIQAQCNITLEGLYRQSTVLLLGGAAAAALPLVFPGSGAALWASTILFGLLNGPALGYSYDMLNRVTKTSEEGMSIVMFGLNCGASFVPYVISGVWEASQWPGALFAVLIATHVLPYPALLVVRALHREGYEGITTSDQ